MNQRGHLLAATASRRTLYALALAALGALLAVALSVNVAAHGGHHGSATAVMIDADGNQIGVAGFTGTDDGTHIIIALTGLTPGKHGVHIHSNGSCADSTNDQGQAVTFGGAGGHLDPHDTKHHGGPETSNEQGHAGDMPNIEIGEDGRGILEFTTDKVTVDDGEVTVVDRSVVIHANEDNYSDEPALGGSGARVACGVIQGVAGTSR